MTGSRRVSLFALALPLALLCSPAVPGTGPAGAQSICDGAILLQHDDGSFENGYGWSGPGSRVPDFGAWAERYESDVVCSVQFLFIDSGDFQDQTMDVFVWSDESGNPGTVLCVLRDIDPGPIAPWPQISIHDVPINCETGGPHFVGFWGEWPGAVHGWYLAADENGSGSGSPRTRIAPGLGYPTGWNHPNVVPFYSGIRGVGIRELALQSSGLPEPRGVVPATWGAVKAFYAPGR
jgi:hypothetical protein